MKVNKRGPTVLTYLIQIGLMLLPWSVRRRLLEAIFGFDISPSARIGFSIVAPRSLRLGDGAIVGHLNVIRGMDLVDLGEGAEISHLNWVFGLASAELISPDGPSALIMDEGAGITRRHLIDCSAPVRLGKFCLVAGYGSQIVTHAVVLSDDHQGAKAIVFGDHAFIGSRSIVLGGRDLASLLRTWCRIYPSRPFRRGIFDLFGSAGEACRKDRPRSQVLPPFQRVSTSARPATLRLLAIHPRSGRLIIMSQPIHRNRVRGLAVTVRGPNRADAQRVSVDSCFEPQNGYPREKETPANGRE